MITKQEYIDALGQMEELYYNSDKCTLAMSLFKEDIKLLTGLVNECFEQKECQKEVQKRETNFEHYIDEIATVDFDFAIKDGKIMPCKDCFCSECRFDDRCVACYIKRLKWLYQEYKEKIRLTQFEYDLIKTFDHCKECCVLNEIEPLKKLSEKGYFKGINPFTKVHEIIDNCEVIK